MTLVQITHPDPQAPTAVYTLTLANPPDHRLTTALLADLLTALDEIERDWWARRDAWKADQARLDESQRAKGLGSVGGAVIIRGEGEKFFSNGTSIRLAAAESILSICRSCSRCASTLLRSLVRRLAEGPKVPPVRCRTRRFTCNRRLT